MKIIVTSSFHRPDLPEPTEPQRSIRSDEFPSKRPGILFETIADMLPLLSAGHRGAADGPSVRDLMHRRDPGLLGVDKHNLYASAPEHGNAVMTLPPCPRSCAPGRKRQQRRVDVRVFASRPCRLAQACGSEGISGRPQPSGAWRCPLRPGRRSGSTDSRISVLPVRRIQIFGVPVELQRLSRREAPGSRKSSPGSVRPLSGRPQDRKASESYTRVDRDRPCRSPSRSRFRSGLYLYSVGATCSVSVWACPPLWRDGLEPQSLERFLRSMVSIIG